MNPRELLCDDHASLDALLQEVKAALSDGDIQALARKFDLFWARLAVHIRGEHLHLFPAVLGARKNDPTTHGPSLAEAAAVVDSLRVDHDFFMKELARAVALVRDQSMEQTSQTLATIRDILRAVESQLKKHNEIEEAQLYPLTVTLLTAQQLATLMGQLRHELMNRPKRFAADSWPEKN